MGCCASSPREPTYHDTSPTGAAADSSRAAITRDAVRPSSIASGTPRTSQHNGRGGSNNAPNKPLKPAPPSSKISLPKNKNVRWTAIRLEREREEFFDTRVTGRTEIWAVVKLVCELLRQGEVPEAQGVLDAAGCTCPTGEVWKGIFDERGAFYQLPDWTVGDPADLITDDNEEDGAAIESKEVAGLEGDDTVVGAEESDVWLDEIDREKGKGRAGEEVKIKARLSDRATDVVVHVGRDEKVAVLVRKVKDKAGLASTARVRIAYMGKMWAEGETISSQGWRDGHLVNALVLG